MPRKDRQRKAQAKKRMQDKRTDVSLAEKETDSSDVLNTAMIASDDSINCPTINFKNNNAKAQPQTSKI